MEMTYLVTGSSSVRLTISVNQVQLLYRSETMIRVLTVIRSLLKRLGSVFRRRSREMARLRRAANREISYLSEQFERLSAEQEAIKEVLRTEIERLNCEQIQAKMELKRTNESRASAEKHLQFKALELDSALAILGEQIEKTKELQHSLDMVNQLQPMPSQLQLQKGSCCSKCKHHMETLHTQPPAPVIAPQCHQEPRTQLPSPLPQCFQGKNEGVECALQASPIPQCIPEPNEGAPHALLPNPIPQESNEGAPHALLPNPIPLHFQDPKVKALHMTLPQQYQGPTSSHDQCTPWDDLPAFPMTVADLFQPKKSPTAVAEQPANQLRPSQPIVPSPHMQPQYVETPIDGIFLML